MTAVSQPRDPQLAGVLSPWRSSAWTGSAIIESTIVVGVPARIRRHESQTCPLDFGRWKQASSPFCAASSFSAFGGPSKRSTSESRELFITLSEREAGFKGEGLLPFLSTVLR